MRTAVREGRHVDGPVHQRVAGEDEDEPDRREHQQGERRVERHDPVTRLVRLREVQGDVEQGTHGEEDDPCESHDDPARQHEGADRGVEHEVDQRGSRDEEQDIGQHVHRESFALPGRCADPSVECAPHRTGRAPVGDSGSAALPGRATGTWERYVRPAIPVLLCVYLPLGLLLRHGEAGGAPDHTRRPSSSRSSPRHVAQPGQPLDRGAGGLGVGRGRRLRRGARGPGATTGSRAGGRLLAGAGLLTLLMFVDNLSRSTAPVFPDATGLPSACCSACTRFAACPRGRGPTTSRSPTPSSGCSRWRPRCSRCGSW